ncbi:HXXXD-type acyl-transferase family protein [Euphorbia peplus]|nr:HXXXD-type acyl-transferase family protein [Euphorbia peplus]
MEEVRLVSTTLVEAPTNQEPFKNEIELTSSDLKLLLLGSIQKGLLFPKPNSSIPTLIQHLKTSFSQTLRFFYPLAGRLSSTQHQDNTISFFIDCNNVGAQFGHPLLKTSPFQTFLILSSFLVLSTHSSLLLISSTMKAFRILCSEFKSLSSRTGFSSVVL